MTEKIITIRPHRASTMQRAWLCPPAPWRETLMPEMDAGPAAEEGTLLHAAVPRAYRFGDFSGLDEDQRWAMTHCVRLLERLAADVPPACILFEESIEVLDRRLLPILDREVRPDVVIFRPGGLAIVIDWKFGRSVPQFDAGRDLQLLTYAVAVRNGFEGVDRVHVYRFHPRLWDEHRESCVAYEPRPLDNDRNADSFWTGRENVLKRIVAESTPDAPAAPGHAQCLYCKAKLVCKEFARWAEPKPSELPPAVNGSLTPRPAQPRPRLEGPAQAHEQYAFGCGGANETGACPGDRRPRMDTQARLRVARTGRPRRRPQGPSPPTCPPRRSTARARPASATWRKPSKPPLASKAKPPPKPSPSPSLA